MDYEPYAEYNTHCALQHVGASRSLGIAARGALRAASLAEALNFATWNLDDTKLEAYICKATAYDNSSDLRYPRFA